MQNLCAGVVIGVIILQTMVFAPTIFTTIEPAPAGKLLRALFPKFFRLLMLLGVGTLVALWFDDDASPAQYVMAGLTVTLALICAALVPATNRATDEGAKGRFKALHTISVVLTLIILGSNIAIPFL